MIKRMWLYVIRDGLVGFLVIFGAIAMFRRLWYYLTARELPLGWDGFCAFMTLAFALIGGGILIGIGFEVRGKETP